MRMSADSTDVGYDPLAFTSSVFLGGVKLTNCVTADEEKGLCICHAEPLQIVNDEYVRVERRGHVVIVVGQDK